MSAKWNLKPSVLEDLNSRLRDVLKQEDAVTLLRGGRVIHNFGLSFGRHVKTEALEGYHSGRRIQVEARRSG